MLWETFDETLPTHYLHLHPKDPKITVIDENWQRSKCNFLGLQFETASKQPSNLIGLPLRNFEP